MERIFCYCLQGFHWFLHHQLEKYIWSSFSIIDDIWLDGRKRFVFDWFPPRAKQASFEGARLIPSRTKCRGGATNSALLRASSWRIFFLFSQPLAVCYFWNEFVPICRRVKLMQLWGSTPNKTPNYFEIIKFWHINHVDNSGRQAVNTRSIFTYSLFFCVSRKKMKRFYWLP